VFSEAVECENIVSFNLYEGQSAKFFLLPEVRMDQYIVVEK